MDLPTLARALTRATRQLRESGAENPRLDAEVLLANVLGCDRVYLYREPSRILSPGELQKYLRLIGRRAGSEPVAYLTGYKEFMGLDFAVGPHVLIPRPETELLVDYALNLLESWPSGRRIAVDVGTGSGAIAVSLARYAPGTAVFATDISPDALAIADNNARINQVQVNFAQGDLLTPLQGLIKSGSVAVLAANLPYIPTGDIAGLTRDVRDYEPILALDGGPDGLDFYRRLTPQAEHYLAPGGVLLMEIDPGQKEKALQLVAAPRWAALALSDLAGRPRLIAATLV